MSTDISDLNGRPVIIGGGAAGLMTALELAPRPVILLSKSPLGAEASSMWAQGGLAAAVGEDDAPALHLTDTIAAGAGLCDEAAASRIVDAAPAAVERLAKLGVGFDRRTDGGWRLGLEAAHGRNRIVHATGDGTGREIMRALIAEVRRTPSITLLEGVEARRLLVEDGAVIGVLAASDRGALTIATNRIVIATGGIGGLFADSTNPGGCFGQGLALAAHAGARLADLEFVQFHPTAFDGPSRPMPLLTEAIRGDGAVLIDETGARFMADQPGAELAPRDIVARAVWHHRAAGHRTFLDARRHPGADFARRYPVISAFCKMAGIDPASDPIPIRPAVHYHMGGIAVDGEGRSTVQGLWACGEAARTGLHGANRLASNSLLEAMVCAHRAANKILSNPPPKSDLKIPLWQSGDATNADELVVVSHNWDEIRRIMWDYVGIVRTNKRLQRAQKRLANLQEEIHDYYWNFIVTSDLLELRNIATVAELIVNCALQRPESRGLNYNLDFPEANPAWAQRDSVLRKFKS